jgi:hypothetical protein
MRALAAAVVVVLELGTLVGQSILLVRLREHRTDLRPGEHFGQGRSPFWQLNVFNAANYTDEGRRLLRWLPVLQVVWLVSLILAAGFFIGLY